MTDWLYRQCTYAYRSNQFGRTNMFRLMPIQSFGNCWQLLRPEQEILHSPEQITIARNGWCCWWPESDNFIATNLGMLFQFKSLLSNSTNDNVYVFYIHLQNQINFREISFYAWCCTKTDIYSICEVIISLPSDNQKPWKLTTELLLRAGGRRQAGTPHSWPVLYAITTHSWMYRLICIVQRDQNTQMN